MKTQQQIFDAGLAHIRAQGEPSFNRQRKVCLYRMPTADNRTLKCIVGGMMPDEVYRPRFDDEGGVLAPGLPPDVYAAMEIEQTDPMIGLVSELQSAHDRPAIEEPPEDFLPAFERAMRQLAAERNLVYTEPEIK